MKLLLHRFRSVSFALRPFSFSPARSFFVLIIILLTGGAVSAQTTDLLPYVNPFIGTTTSNVFTKWGNEGGTYPGAVAPWSYFQLSPETAQNGNSGYDYKDSAIRYFSCLRHHSGFPGGSGGGLYLMPVTGEQDLKQGRVFRHADEQATPGYYRVLFRDNSTLVEATATTHAGLFRIRFPAHASPVLFIGNAGDIRTVTPTELEGSMVRTFTRSNKTITDTLNLVIFRFNKAVVETRPVAGGHFVRFDPEPQGNTVLTVELSASSAGSESARQNIDAELSGRDFEQVLAKTQADWNRQLSVVTIHDPSESNKTQFYTALYHSLLLPWIVSDVNGIYRGGDRKLHKTSAQNEYGGFSPWDTYRTLHPLLTLLYPERQADMLSSMLDVYRQSGYLPTESMTGNHSIPIVVDSYLKGIRNLDSSVLYEAMKKSIVEAPYRKSDMKLYVQGFIPYPNTESVTRTVEYTFDDWALAQFARNVMHDQSLYSQLMQRSRNYRNLFDPEERCLLPRKGNTFYHGTGNAGYKEGDQWAYTYSLPQYQRDLINLLGGDEHFVDALDAVLKDNRLVFDNETVFHVPYLFNSTSYPYKTQQWVHEIMHNRFSDTPGGLPGNDDLGATSSWYVWSALGLFPVCPGDPVYALGTPLFKEAILSLAGGKTWKITAENGSPENFYVKAMHVNGHPYADKWLSHAVLAKGGRMSFTMSPTPDQKKQPGFMPGETDSSMHIRLSGISVTRRRVNPDDPLWVKFTLQNSGAPGTAIVRLRINDSTLVQKNCLIQHGETRRDSIFCRLYVYGKNRLQIEGTAAMQVMVVKPVHPPKTAPQIIDLQVSPLTRSGARMYYHYTVKNRGGNRQQFILPVLLNDKRVHQDTVMLRPGDSSTERHFLTADLPDGFYRLSVTGKTAPAKVYTNAKDAIVLDMPGQISFNSAVPDRSGFGNDGRQSEEGKFLALPHTPSLDSSGTALTMMAWVYDPGTKRGLIDLIAKGDNHVLQLSGRKLSFFAGGWGRGDCDVSLPEDWVNHWHHIAGVCNGADLRIYIDGELKGRAVVDEISSLNVAAGWTIGSNEEFPLNRTFNGKMSGVKIFTAPLSEQDIKSIYETEKPSLIP